MEITKVTKYYRTGDGIWRMEVISPPELVTNPVIIDATSIAVINERNYPLFYKEEKIDSINFDANLSQQGEQC